MGFLQNKACTNEPRRAAQYLKLTWERRGLWKRSVVPIVIEFYKGNLTPSAEQVEADRNKTTPEMFLAQVQAWVKEAARPLVSEFHRVLVPTTNVRSPCS